MSNSCLNTDKHGLVEKYSVKKCGEKTQEMFTEWMKLFQSSHF